MVQIITCVAQLINLKSYIYAHHNYELHTPSKVVVLVELYILIFQNLKEKPKMN